MTYVVCYTTFKGVDGMTRALILAANLHEYMSLMRTYRLNPAEYRYVRDYQDVIGYWIDKPIILLERYELNKNYTLQLMDYIGHRFDNIGYLSEGEIWNESTIV
jgi:hypothetical protein